MRNVDIKRIEFFMTKHCTGHCKHCSVDYLHHSSELIRENRRWRENVIEDLSSHYKIDSMMLFGGEPLLNSIAASDVLHKAKECGIPKRQMITNAYFSSKQDKVELVCRRLILAGLNHVIISVDYFHQESIQLEYVIALIEILKKYECEIIEIQPCWINGPSFDCYENQVTKKLLDTVHHQTGVKVLSGNILALEGRAMEYYQHYFEGNSEWINCKDVPYMNKIDDIKNLRFMVDGSVTLCKSLTIGHMGNDKILSIIERYKSLESPILQALNQVGVQGVSEILKDEGKIKPSMMSTCEYCYTMLKNVDLY